VVVAGNAILTGRATRPIVWLVGWWTRRGGWVISLITLSSPIAWAARA
jgi:hypothetical protein